MRTAAVLVVLLVAGWAWTNHSRHVTEHRLAGVASEPAGRPVGVRLGGTQAEGLAVASLVLALQPGVSPEYQFASCRCLRARRFPVPSS